jgi:hypothetical protein
MRIFATCFLLGAAALQADFSYTMSTEMKSSPEMEKMMAAMKGAAGALGRATTITHLYKGDKSAMVTGDSITIQDAANGTITSIDLGAKTYTVSTFADMLEGLKGVSSEAARAKAGMAKDGMPAMNMKMTAKATGKTKVIQGLTAKEVVLSTDMSGMTGKAGKGKGGEAEMAKMMGSRDTSMWFAKLPGSAEMEAFNAKLAKLYGAQAAGLATEMKSLAGGMGMGNMEEVQRVIASVGGTGVETSTTMAMGMQMTNKLTGFSSAAIETSKFEVPAGFKKVDARKGR